MIILMLCLLDLFAMLAGAVTQRLDLFLGAGAVGIILAIAAKIQGTLEFNRGEEFLRRGGRNRHR